MKRLYFLVAVTVLVTAAEATQAHPSKADSAGVQCYADIQCICNIPTTAIACECAGQTDSI